MAASARVRKVLEEAATLTAPERVELFAGMAKNGLVSRQEYEKYVGELPDLTHEIEASPEDITIDLDASLDPTHGFEASESSPLFTKEDMARQRKAILEFLSIPAVSGTPPTVSADKYSVLGKHDIEV
jgi:hypothetical protein